MSSLLYRRLHSVRCFHYTAITNQIAFIKTGQPNPSETLKTPNRFLAKYTSAEKNQDRRAVSNNRPPRENRDDRGYSKSPGTQIPNRFATSYEKTYPQKQPYDSLRRSKHRRPDVQPKKVTRFEFKTGSEQARAVLKSVLSKARDYDSSLRVRFLDPETKKISTGNLVDVSNSLDLNFNGLMVLPPSEDLSHPMVKVIPVASMLKAFADQLAARKERELLEMGSVSAKRAVKQRLKVEKKKLATKFLSISWKISLGDLKNQKRDEILRRLAKQEKFTISITGKRTKLVVIENDDTGEYGDSEDVDVVSPDSIRFSKEFADEQDLHIELMRRENLKDGLCQILDEQHCTYEVEGNTETRLMIRVSPKEAIKSAGLSPKQNQDMFSTKDLRRQRRAEKQKTSSTAKTQDLDLLYSMKIEN